MAGDRWQPPQHGKPRRVEDVVLGLDGLVEVFDDAGHAHAQAKPEQNPQEDDLFRWRVVGAQWQGGAIDHAETPILALFLDPGGAELLAERGVEGAVRLHSSQDFRGLPLLRAQRRQPARQARDPLLEDVLAVLQGGQLHLGIRDLFGHRGLIGRAQRQPNGRPASRRNRRRRRQGSLQLVDLGLGGFDQGMFGCVFLLEVASLASRAARRSLSAWRAARPGIPAESFPPFRPASRRLAISSLAWISARLLSSWASWAISTEDRSGSLSVPPRWCFARLSSASCRLAFVWARRFSMNCRVARASSRIWDRLRDCKTSM